MKPPLSNKKQKTKFQQTKILMQKNLSFSPKSQAEITEFLKQVLSEGSGQRVANENTNTTTTTSMSSSSSITYEYTETDTHHIWISKENNSNITNDITNSNKIQNCIDEVKAFVRGGIPGFARLSEVYRSICIHFEITSDLEYYQVMYQAGAPLEIWKHWLPPSKWHLHH
jgi:hypothetical protein